MTIDAFVNIDGIEGESTSITIELCRAGGKKIKYFEYNFTNCIVSSFYKDAVLSPGFYFFLNPYVKIIYIIGLTILIGKEFLLKKPITAKIKINIFAVVLLIILVSAQFLLWQHAIVNFAT